LRTASDVENPDLFWAIRGGGGNFGIATSFEFRLHPVGTIFAGPILYPLEQATEAMRFYRDFMRTAPRELSAFFAFLIVPPGPPFPEPLHMKTVCGVVCAYCGDPADGEAATKPLREFGPPLFALNVPMPYPMLQSLFDALLPAGLQHYWKADFVQDLTDTSSPSTSGTDLGYPPSILLYTSTPWMAPCTTLPRMRRRSRIAMSATRT
jgi:hypothetical protein